MRSFPLLVFYMTFECSLHQLDNALILRLSQEQWCLQTGNWRESASFECEIPISDLLIHPALVLRRSLLSAINTHDRRRWTINISNPQAIAWLQRWWQRWRWSPNTPSSSWPLCNVMLLWPLHACCTRLSAILWPSSTSSRSPAPVLRMTHNEGKRVKELDPVLDDTEREAKGV